MTSIIGNSEKFDIFEEKKSSQNSLGESDTETNQIYLKYHLKIIGKMSQSNATPTTYHIIDDEAQQVRFFN